MGPLSQARKAVRCLAKLYIVACVLFIQSTYSFHTISIYTLVGSHFPSSGSMYVVNQENWCYF